MKGALLAGDWTSGGGQSWYPEAISITDVRCRCLQTVGTLHGPRRENGTQMLFLGRKQGGELEAELGRAGSPQPVIYIEKVALPIPAAE